MRICLYVGKAPVAEDLQDWLTNAKTTSDVYARNLHREFTRRGHEVLLADTLPARPREVTAEQAERRLARYSALEYPQADHAICLQQNGWWQREPVFFERARAATGGAVCTICDNDLDIEGPQDLLFCARRPVGDAWSRSVYVGWAAEPQLFFPEQDAEWLTIFIDHKSTPGGDDTEALLKSATTFAAQVASAGRRVGNPPRRVQVVLFSPTGIERIEPDEIRDVDLGSNPREFYGTRVPGPELAAWLRKTDIFLVTHKESMGLPVLESAMAGALVVARRNFIRPELLRPLDHFEYDSVEEIDWDRLVGRLQPQRSRRRAIHFTWDKVADRMLHALESRTWKGSAKPRERNNNGGNLLATADLGEHAIELDRAKEPWPQLCNLSFLASPSKPLNILATLGGEFPEESVQVRFDVAELRPYPQDAASGWTFLAAAAVPSGDAIRCEFTAVSDWAPILRCRLTLVEPDGTPVAADHRPSASVRDLKLTCGSPADHVVTHPTPRPDPRWRW